MAAMYSGGAAKATAGEAAASQVAADTLVGGDGSGLESLMDKFGAAGLGGRVQSWVGKGTNLPVSADQIKSVLESDQVAAVASRLGMTPDQAVDTIAGVLPGLIDKVTPDGIVPDPDDLAQKLAGLAKQQMTK